MCDDCCGSISANMARTDFHWQYHLANLFGAIASDTEFSQDVKSLLYCYLFDISTPDEYEPMHTFTFVM